MSSPHKKSPASPHKPDQESAERVKCGVVMPIADIDGYPAAHWADVLEIIKSSLDETKFDVELVSADDVSGIIHKRIVQNLVSNPIVICDVSARNPNVMFELGLRLAFDKATIIIKDDATPYSFDTGSIDHIPYPRDLRFHKIVEFKQKLVEKVSKTLEASQQDPEYSVFLKHFAVSRPPANLPTEERTPWEIVMKEIAQLRQDISNPVISTVSGIKDKRKASETTSKVLLSGPRENIETMVESLPGGLSSQITRTSSHEFILGGSDRLLQHFLMYANRNGLTFTVTQF